MSVQIGKRRWTGKLKRPSKKGRWMVAKKKGLSAKVSELIRNQELKWFDVTLSSASPSSVVPLNNVPMGDDSTTRDGRKIRMKSCYVKLFASNVSSWPRFAIVYDKVNNGTLPSYTEIFDSVGGPAAQFNLNNRHRFVILYDNHAGIKKGRDPFFFAGGTGTAFFGDVQYIKLDHETIYGATGGGTIAGTLSGALYIVFLGASGSSDLNCQIRTRFIDS